MADLPTTTDQQAAISDAIKEFYARLGSTDAGSALSKWLENAIIEVIKTVVAAIGPAAAVVGTGLVTGISEAEVQLTPALERLARDTMRALTGVDVPASFADVGGAGADSRADHVRVGKDLLAALTAGARVGTDGSIVPSTEGAEAFTGMMTSLAFRGWMKGVIFELVGLTQLESFGELDDILVAALGLNRMARGVMRPIANAMITQPATWDMNKRFRPQLLSYFEVARQTARGRMTVEQAREELARQGYSDTRIDALLNAAAKFHSVPDADLLERAGVFTHAQAVQHLRDQGYDEATAERELTIERLKRIQSFERSLANAAVDAYADGRIGPGALHEWTRGTTIDQQEGAQLRELAEARRALRIRPLTSSEVARLVRDKILGLADYRRALEREARDPEAVLALDLALRRELDEAAELDELRAAQDAERAAERAARDEARAAKEAAVAEQRAQARLGSLADFKTAVVRGKLPIAAYAARLAQEYDGDIVDALVSIAEDERLAYVERQQAAADATRRAAARGLSLGDVEQAVLAGVITIDDYRRRLDASGFDPGDRDLLVATLQARLDDQAAAEAARDDAVTAARARSIDLGRFEQLVRRGARTLAQYDALLVDLGFDEPARAGMRELLELKIADDQAAQQATDDAADVASPEGLTVAEFRRAVLLGLQTRDAFATFLSDQNFTVDKQRLQLAELDAAVEEAEAARARRAAADAAPDTRGIPLADLRRAARLGIVAPDVYTAELVALGYAPDDVDIELQLLLVEIADTQDARLARDVAPPSVDTKELTLAELARAVRLGLKTLPDYQARAFALGFSADAVATQVRVLADELAETELAKARRAAIAGESEERDATLAELEQAVREGALDLQGYADELVRQGLAPVDVELLAALLDDELGG